MVVLPALVTVHPCIIYELWSHYLPIRHPCIWNTLCMPRGYISTTDRIILNRCCECQPINCILKIIDLLLKYINSLVNLSGFRCGDMALNGGLLLDLCLQILKFPFHKLPWSVIIYGRGNELRQPRKKEFIKTINALFFSLLPSCPHGRRIPYLSNGACISFTSTFGITIRWMNEKLLHTLIKGYHKHFGYLRCCQSVRSISSVYLHNETASRGLALLPLLGITFIRALFYKRSF